MQNIPDSLCYLNGEYGSLRDAKVSVLDRGFVFGDGVYEVVPAYAGKLFRFDEHMARLNRSLGKLRIANPHSSDEWLEAFITASVLSQGRDPPERALPDGSRL